MKIMVMDGQGGGIGSTIIKGLRKDLGGNFEILALGTNSIATSQMMKAGANRGATGENAIVYTCPKVDIILGSLSILMPNAMMGEVSPGMSEAVCSSNAHKILIPLTQENLSLVGIINEPLPHLVHKAIKKIEEIL